MQQQQICQLLKQIIPQLQNKIRQQLKQQYQYKIKQIQQNYQNQIQDLIAKHNQIIKQHQDSLYQDQLSYQQQKEKQWLFRRITMLQAQRKNWCRMQQQYQATIQQLTTLLTTLTSQNQAKSSVFSSKQKKSNLNLKLNANSNTNKNKNRNVSKQQIFGEDSISAIHLPPKSNIDVSQIYRPFKKDKQPVGKDSKDIGSTTAIVNNNINKVEKFANQHKDKKDVSSIKNESMDNSLVKYLQNQDINSNTKNEQENRQHYHSVLSPPKQKEEQQPKQQLQVQNPQKQARLFWDQNKKKQLLSLIKLN